MANQPVQDIQTDFSGGQNASQIPAHVAPNEYYIGINTSCQKGALNPRWGAQQKNLIFNITEEYALPTGLTRSYEDIYYTGRYQATIPYLVGTEKYLIEVINGIIFAINLNSFEVSYIPISDGSYIAENHKRVNWNPGGKYIFLYDFPSYPVIIEGLTARRADPALDEIPVSVMGTYNQNRVLFANALDEWSATDPAAYAFPDGPVSCTEILTPASAFYGQIFKLSTNANNSPITAMGYLQVVDSSTGIGPALIATQDNIYSYHTELPRTQWEATQFGSIFVQDAGIVGPRAFCNVNSDLFFISKEGELRTASMSRNEQNKWSKTPITKEVRNFITNTTNEGLAHSVVSYFKNKIFMTVSPYTVLATSTDYKSVLDTAFGGMCVLELDNVSTLSKESPPVWAGLWTPCRPMDMVTSGDKMYLIAKTDGRNSIWEITPDVSYDVVGREQKIRRIKSKVYTKEFEFNAPFSLKTLKALDFNLQEVKGTFKLKVKYKPSHASNFIEWRTFTYDAPWKICNSLPFGCQWNGLSSHSFRELNLGSPIDSGCTEVTKDKYDMFRMVQLLFEIEGIDWQIESYILHANLLPQNLTETHCKVYPVVEICEECNNDWEIPNLCQENLET